MLAGKAKRVCNSRSAIEHSKTEKFFHKDFAAQLSCQACCSLENSPDLFC